MNIEILHNWTKSRNKTLQNNKSGSDRTQRVKRSRFAVCVCENNIAASSKLCKHTFPERRETKMYKKTVRSVFTLFGFYIKNMRERD